ncbi:MAG: hypothetical protein AAF098_16820 [Pseudomonadota bacterium]
MNIVLHAGPMKTGSTAFQRMLELSRSKLIEGGCFPVVFSAAHPLLTAKSSSAQNQFIDEVYKKARTAGCDTLLLSSEHLTAIHKTETLQWIARLADSAPSIHAIVVRRPLRELYPSLYLQNLKGPRGRVTSFTDFVDEQLEIDRTRCWSENCTSFNYPCLRERLERAGASVDEIPYSRDSFITRLLEATVGRDRFVENRILPDEKAIADWRAKLAQRSGIDSSRTLAWPLVPAVIEINRLSLSGVLDKSQRNRILTALLNASSKLKNLPSPVDELLEKIDVVDRDINGGADESQASYQS